MKRLKTIYAGIETSSVSLSVCFNQCLSDELKSLLKLEFLFYIFSLLTIALSYVFLRKLLGLLMDKVTWVKKNALKKDYVEGAWFDILYINGEIHSVGLSYIQIEGTEVRISGDDYNVKEVNKFGYYASDFATFNNSTFKYSFTYTYSDNNTSLRGYTELEFLDSYTYPMAYRGSSVFKDEYGEKRYVFEGQRIEDLAILKELTCPHPQRRRKLLRMLESYLNE